MYKVEKDVPLPGTESKFPLETMEVGDSFLVTDTAPSTVRTILIRASKKLEGKKFITATVANGIRIWRSI